MRYKTQGFSNFSHENETQGLMSPFQVSVHDSQHNLVSLTTVPTKPKMISELQNTSQAERFFQNFPLDSYHSFHVASDSVYFLPLSAKSLGWGFSDSNETLNGFSWKINEEMMRLRRLPGMTWIDRHREKWSEKRSRGRRREDDGGENWIWYHFKTKKMRENDARKNLQETQDNHECHNNNARRT